MSDEIYTVPILPSVIRHFKLDDISFEYNSYINGRLCPTRKDFYLHFIRTIRNNKYQ